MSYLKPFVINSTDIQFILDQLNFRPLFDFEGNAIIMWNGSGAIYDAQQKLIWNGSFVPSLTTAGIHNAAEAIATYGTSYQSLVDLAGLRDVTGLNNNLSKVNADWGAVDEIFTRSAAADYANYSPTVQAVASAAYAAAKEYYGKYSDGSAFDGSPTGKFNLNGSLNTNYAITKDTSAGTQPGDTLASDGTSINIQNVVDYTPRMISQLTTTAGVTYDTWANHQADPAALAHGKGEIYYDGQGLATVTDWGLLDTVANGGLGQVDTQARLAASAGQNDHFIGGLNPGVSPSNGFFVLFGQFFDHGLDFIGKASGATIKIALATDDPLYGMLGPDGRPVHEITISRATVQTVDANGPEYVNHASPYIDQSQTYGSHAQLTALLREWVRDPGAGQYHAGMKLLDGATLATAWTKADGTVTNETLPTLAELRAHVLSTGRDALTWEDVNDLRNRDEYGHVSAGTSGSALLLDMNPRFDAGHMLGFYDTNGDGVRGAGEASYGNADQAALVNTAIATIQEDVRHQFGAGSTFGIDATTHKLTLFMQTLPPGTPPGTPHTLDGASALYPYVNFADFSITASDADVHKAVGEILMASVGDHYIAGDGRINENFGLTSIHHIFHEEHNYQIDNLIAALHRQDIATNDTSHAALHGFQVDTGHMNGAGDFVYADGSIAWDQDKMFNAGKLVVEMEYQHAAVDQYARNVSPNIQEFVGYSSSVNGAISLEYAQAAFRFGHSTLRETIDIIDPSHGLTGKIMGYALKEAFLSPEKFAGIGPAAIVLGMSHQQMNEVDEFVTPALTQGLLGQPLDLAAINIARGRDIGIPTLNDFREAVGLGKYTSWTDFGQNMQHPSSLANFIAAYSFDGNLDMANAIVGIVEGTVAAGTLGVSLEQAYGFMNGDEAAGGTGTLGFDHIDTWLGGLAEVHQPGGLLGETFDKVFVNQIESLMDGDRFYYLYRLAGQQFAEEVGNGQLKDIVERNTGLTHLNGNIFGYADQYVDLGAHKEVVASGAEAQTVGNDHKWGDIAAVADGTIGVYSNGGLGNLNDGKEVVIGGVHYVQDTRLADTDPDSAYSQNGGVNLDGSPNSGAESSEVIVGTKGSDLIYAQGGDDTVYGDDGNDIIYGGFGIDRLYGGNGNDRIYGGDNPDLIDGGSGDDFLYGESSGSDINGADQIIGGSGNDFISGGIGIDKLSGGTGDDRIYGDQDTDPFTHGGDGNDFVDGGTGGDILYGDNGDDVLVGGADQDQLFGGSGDDILRPGDTTGALTIGTDEVLGGDGVTDEGGRPGTTGFDLVDFSDNAVRPGGVKFDLSNQANPGTTLNGTPTQIATFQIEGVVGSAGGDTLTGDEGANWLIGGSGNDVMSGAAGNDVIIGGSIRLDTLIGRYVDANGNVSTYDHNNGNDGSTEELRLQDARYDGASHRVGYTDVLSAGLLGNAALKTEGFEKHFTEMLRTDMFKDLVLGNGGSNGTDTATYSGSQLDYQVTYIPFTDAHGSAIQAFKIQDLRPGSPDGTDILVGIQKVAFNYVAATGAGTVVDIFNTLDGAPSITNTVLSRTLAENTATAVDLTQNGQTPAGTLVGTLTATDVLTAGQLALGSGPTSLTWSVSGTDPATAGLFAITAAPALVNGALSSSSATLSLAQAPDFEALRAAGATVNPAGQLVLTAHVTVSDGTLSATQDATVLLGNVDEKATGAIHFTGATVIGNTVAFTPSAGTFIDPDVRGSPVLTYGLSGTGAPANGLTYTATNNGSIHQFQLSGTYAQPAPLGQGQTTSPDSAFVGTGVANTMSGTFGADVLVGLGGADTYLVNNTGDLVVEGLNGGIDNVLSSLNSYTLTANVENLTFTGAGNFTGKGNELANSITGGGGDDRFIATVDAVRDTYNGGDGSDTVDYSAYATALTVDFTKASVIVASSGSTNATSDLLNAIENFIGGGGNDTVVAARDDVANIFDGGGGSNTASYAAYNAGLAVDFNQATVIVAGSGSTPGTSDTLVHIQNFVGGTGNDKVVAATDAIAHLFDGGSGVDTIDFSHFTAGLSVDLRATSANAAGYATVVGSGPDATHLALIKGFETLAGGSGGDSLTVGAGTTTFTGNAGHDVMVFNPGTLQTGAARDVFTDFVTHAGATVPASADQIDLTFLGTLIVGHTGAAFLWDGQGPEFAAGRNTAAEIRYHVEGTGITAHTILDYRAAGGGTSATGQIDLGLGIKTLVASGPTVDSLHADILHA